VNSTDPFSSIKQQLTQRKEQNRFRTLTTIEGIPSASTLVMDGKEYINFSSNDYLGLSGHPEIKNRSIDFTEMYGAGSSSSRLITGTYSIHTALEEKLAAVYQKEKALLYSTGFQANSTILPAITQKGDWILSDRKCHNSILTGCLASRAKMVRFRHNDLDHLETLLKKADKAGIENVWIITESLFSMDGDIAPLDEMINFSKKYGSKIYVDDAHAIGLYGNNGFGLTEGVDGIDLIVGTFGKSVGSFGAFVASNQTVIDALINFSSGFIYTTALPPAVIGAVDAAYDLIPQMHSEREHIKRLAEKIRSELKIRKIRTNDGDTQIVPVILGEDQKVINCSERLKKAEIFAYAIRPPTVPENESLIRVSITAGHSESQIKQLIHILSIAE
jgi:8-amino-7-oxononanoate synthase